ncbi:unnamed protein product [Adineta steineri]|uniref:glutamate decarboxylase n=1 Tax=Adineta steineri TaxID=433720 RepID=A0A818Z9B9_9BILA|nr:unnamed protein product [Adineta steineri]
MVAPFVFPEVEWDFRLEQVRSINTSDHKYGLVLPGLGWVIWRRKEDLPEDLIFHVNYLGVDEPTFNFNFSRSATNVIAQYYQFLRLGVDGYERIMQLSVDKAKYVAESLTAIDEELFISHSQHDKPFQCGWIIRAYTLAANANDITVCRIVVRETFTRNIASILIEDIRLTLLRLTDEHGHEDLVNSLKAAHNSKHHHRRSTQHRQKIDIRVRSNKYITGNQNGNSKVKKKHKHPTVHTIC